MQLKIVFFMQYSSEVQGPKCTRKARLKKRTHTCSFLKRAQKKLIRMYAVVFCFTLYKLLRPMSVDLKFSTLKSKVIDCLKPKDKSVFQFSVSDFNSVKTAFIKHVFLCQWGINLPKIINAMMSRNISLPGLLLLEGLDLTLIEV